MAIAQQKISALEKEVRQLRSFMIGLSAKDTEGEYRPEFVEKILRASNEKSVYRFQGKSAFLTERRRRKVS